MSTRHLRFDAYLNKHAGTTTSSDETSDETPETERPKRPKITEEVFQYRVADARSGSNPCIEDLISTARGAALILDSMWEGMEDDRESSIISGLASALRNAVEPADAYFFESAGELNKRIPPRHLVLLLEKQLERARLDAVAMEADLAAKKAAYNAKYKENI